MSEWWSYGLSDFLLFSPRTFFRLFELHNRALWPLQVATVIAGLALLLPAVRRRPAALFVLAALWAWVGWSFLWSRYATINWASTYLAYSFWAQAALLAFAAARTAAPRGAGPRIRHTGLGLLVVGVAVYPALAAVLSRDWRQAEAFGVAPDPTAIATLGLLLMTGAPGWLAIIPIAWCVVSALTLYVMGVVDAVFPALAAVAGVVALAVRGLKKARPTSLSRP